MQYITITIATVAVVSLIGLQSPMALRRSNELNASISMVKPISAEFWD
ncbi:MAG: hypothetical protein SOR95_02170 [Sutterella sp.]|nr:hypothetical protein [Sutterella sp.]